MKLIGTKPRPRILVWGVHEDEAVVDFIRTIAPTVKVLTSASSIILIRQEEWDAAIIFGDPPSVTSFSSRLMVIQFGGSERIVQYHLQGVPSPIGVRAASPSVATEFILPDSVPSGISRMVQSSLLPFVRSRAANPVLAEFYVSGSLYVGATSIDPFLLDGDGRSVAGRIERGDYQWWWLPEGTPDVHGWISTALSEWSKSAPDTFPSEPQWANRPEWQTPKERASKAQLSAFHEERQRLIADLDGRERAETQNLDRLRRAADRAERRLLTAQGDDLVDEVKSALEELGFEVTDVDQELAARGDLLEDLRVEDPDIAGWISLVEVRGYAGGAKVSDLQRIGRFVERYIRVEGQPPSARWYIVNHHIGQDPASRPVPLASNPEEVAIFAETDGLVIDTRSLFSVRDKVQSGSAQPRTIRKSLRDATGVYTGF